MSRTLNRLTALKVEKAKQPGLYADGGGLYLRVTPSGTRNWVYRFMVNGRARWMGLGPVGLYSLQEARERALECRRQRHDGTDPIEARRAQRSRELLDAAKAMTFSDCAEAYVQAHRPGWRNAKHVAQWQSTLATYADPIIGKLPVQVIDTALVMKVLEQEVRDASDGPATPFWTARPETASRLRGRIEAILDWAQVRGFREGENPARWRGHLSSLLPARDKVRRVEHHAALPFAETAKFMADLRQREGTAARALEYLIFTAGRTGEVLGARWSEVDLEAKVWTVPAERIKVGEEHRVPLSEDALRVLASQGAIRDSDYVFPGRRRSKPLSNMSMLVLLRRMGRGDLTAHGFRSTFRDWAAERTTFPGEVAEAALAHTVGNKVEAAYRRGDLFEKRRLLMEQWAAYCTTLPRPDDVVVPLARRRSGGKHARQ